MTSDDVEDDRRRQADVMAACDAALSRWTELSSEVAGSADDEEAGRRVARLLDLDEVAANAVLALQLKRLARSHRDMIAGMLAELLAPATIVAPEQPAAPALGERCDVDPQSLRRNDFRVHRALPTRWSDDDTYGHVNNTVHYQLFDTAVNGWLIEATGTDIRTLPAVGLVVESGCR